MSAAAVMSSQKLLAFCHFIVHVDFMENRLKLYQQQTVRSLLVCSAIPIAITGSDPRGFGRRLARGALLATTSANTLHITPLAMRKRRLGWMKMCVCVSAVLVLSLEGMIRFLRPGGTPPEEIKNSSGGRSPCLSRRSQPCRRVCPCKGTTYGQQLPFESSPLRLPLFDETVQILSFPPEKAPNLPVTLSGQLFSC